MHRVCRASVLFSYRFHKTFQYDFVSAKRGSSLCIFFVYEHNVANTSIKVSLNPIVKKYSF